MFRTSLALRILLLNLLFIVLPLLIYFLFFARLEYEERVRENVLRLRNIGLSRTSYLDQFINDQYRSLDLVEQLADLNNPASLTNLNPLLDSLKLDQIYPVMAFFTLHQDGHFLVTYASNKEEMNLDITYRGYIKPTVQYGYYTYLAYANLTLIREFIVSKLVRDQATYAPLGILIYFIAADGIINTLTTNKYLPHEETISLLTEDKIVFASSNSDFLFTALAPVPEEHIIASAKNGQFGKNKAPQKTLSLSPYSNISGVYSWNDTGHTHVGYLSPLAKGSLFVLVDVDMKTISDPYIRATWLTIGVLFSITLISCLLTMLLGEYISRTFRALITVMDKVGQGDLSARFKKQLFGFEINEAGLVLNEMLDRLVLDTDIANKERLKTETVSQQLKVGRDIQKSLLSHTIPSVPGLEIGAASHAASEVSGEFYDIYLKEGHLIITMATTSGKGLSSCLFLVDLRSIIRCFLTRFTNLGPLLEQVNNLFHQDLQNNPLIVKTIIGAWDAEKQTLHYAAASPSFGFTRLREKQFETLGGSHQSMGASATASYTSYELRLPPQGIVIFYTNGIIEQQDPEGHFYGENKLREFVDQKAFLDAPSLAIEIMKDVKKFAQGAPQNEDMTIIVLKATGESDV